MHARRAEPGLGSLGRGDGWGDRRVTRCGAAVGQTVWKWKEHDVMKDVMDGAQEDAVFYWRWHLGLEAQDPV